MPKGMMVVTSRPASADETAAYHRWYDTVHVPEMLAVEGFTSARRFEGPDGEFVAIYEVDDVELAQGALAAARTSGTRTPPVGMQLDPPPSVVWLRARG